MYKFQIRCLDRLSRPISYSDMLSDKHGGSMEETIIQIMAKAMTSANLPNPHPQPSVTRLQSAIPNFNARHFSVEALKALEAAGYEIKKKDA